MNDLDEPQPSSRADIVDSDIPTNRVELNKNRKEVFSNFHICSI
jgi:hypothetical protein